jgi:hypothetical protein
MILFHQLPGVNRMISSIPLLINFMSDYLRVKVNSPARSVGLSHKNRPGEPAGTFTPLLLKKHA